MEEVEGRVGKTTEAEIRTTRAEHHPDAQTTSSDQLKARYALGKFHLDLMAGTAMGGAVHTIVAPIGRATLLMQTQEEEGILGYYPSFALIFSFKRMPETSVRTRNVKVSEGARSRTGLI